MRRRHPRLVPLARFAVLLLASLAVAQNVAVPAAGAQERTLPVRDLGTAVRADLPRPGASPFLGVVTSPGSGGLVVARVVPGSAAERAGVRRGDVLSEMDGLSLREPADLDRALARGAPGSRLTLRARRTGSLLDLAVTLGARRTPSSAFRRPVFRLAVVPLTFAGESAPDRTAALTKLFFDRTGTRGSGASLHDYFAAQSRGRLRVEGRVLAPIAIGESRSRFQDRAMGAAAGSVFAVAARALLRREGAAAMAAYDGLAFLHEPPQETRSGRALWPHRSLVDLGARRVPYYVHVVGEAAGDLVGEHCHEFGHLLGLVDEYGVGHRTGSGDFCVMALGHRGGGRSGAASPFSLCASCRTRLGWVAPVTLDPRVPQRVRIRPGQVALVPLSPGTEEYLLLETRRRAGFDRELPSVGLLVWRVGGAPTRGQGRYANHLDLVEAHGVDTFDAALVRPHEIAFPTARARDLTPETTPSIWSSRRGAFRLYLTDMAREPDGSVVVTLGVARRVRQSPPAHYAGDRPDADGLVLRTDPITGHTVRFRVGGAADPAIPAGTRR